jgi:hypothetical protein
MLTRQIRCPACHVPLAPESYNTGTLRECPGCKRSVRVEAFPALLAPPRLGVPAERVGVEAESSCFFHPAKKAVVPCDGCGRFLCSVCDIQLGEQHLCPQCLESGKKKGKLQQLQNRRTLYDSMALAFATYPMLIFYLTIVTAPIAIYLSIRYWNAPGSLVRRSKWRFMVALVLASAQLVGWGALLVMILR